MNPPRNRKSEDGNPPPTTGATELYPDHVQFCEGLGVKLPGATHPVICFQYREDAEKVMEVLPKRFAKYGLTLHPEKTRLLEFRTMCNGEGKTAGSET